MLLGRIPELARIDQALAEARLGRGSALLIQGEPGIGKTELLTHAIQSAGEMSVLSARGVQFEADVPYSGLHELLMPAFGHLDRLPTAQAAALRSSLGLGERIEADRLVVGAATLGLITTYAEQKPLLVVVDDAHWLDGASAGALAFAARRLAVDAIALLVALRSGESSPFLAAGLPGIHLEGLDTGSAEALLRRDGEPISSDVVDWVVAATAGNPLALIELGAEATRLKPPAGDAPLPISTSVERAYLRRAATLSENARCALLLLSALGSADPEHVASAAGKLGLPFEAVEEAEAAAGLVLFRRGHLEFVHPLARAAIYHAASTADRRAAHRALAEVMTDPADTDRRAWHQAAAAVGPDPAAAAAMEEAGERARQRTACAAAAAAFVEAARLSEDGELRSKRLVSGATCAWLAGDAEQAVRLLEQATPLAESPDLRCDIEALLGHIAIRQGDVDRGQQILVAAATAIRDHDRLKAIRLLGDACISAYGFGHPERRLDAARLALELIRSDDPPEFRGLAHVAYGTHAVLAASGADGPAHMRESVTLFGVLPAERMDTLLLMAAGIAGIFLREAEAGRELLERVLLVARESAPTGALPMLLFFLGRDAATTAERWSVARAFYEEAARIAVETTQLIWQANSVAGLAWLDAYEGREEGSRDHAALAMELAERYDMGFIKAWSLTALGQLELGLGRPQKALEHLLECSVELERIGVSDPDLAPAPDLVDAYVRLGRSNEARQVLDAYAPVAEAKGQPFALARSARARALLAPAQEIGEAFATALSYHAQTPDTFERARTELFFGERLRRARRRVEARRQLRAALRTFERLGAAPWADRALAELRASGETARPRDDSHRLTLTPQELQVALAIAEGRTTREAAAKLYLSPKTIEYHLHSIYDKLEIRSREELASALGVT